MLCSRDSVVHPSWPLYFPGPNPKIDRANGVKACVAKTIGLHPPRAPLTPRVILTESQYP